MFHDILQLQKTTQNTIRYVLRIVIPFTVSCLILSMPVLYVTWLCPQLDWSSKEYLLSLRLDLSTSATFASLRRGNASHVNQRLGDARNFLRKY